MDNGYIRFMIAIESSVVIVVTCHRFKCSYIILAHQ